jgi:hypothetical protein
MRYATALFALLALALTPGCAIKPRSNVTRVTYTFPGHSLVHMAVVPSVLADGSPSDETREELLQTLLDRGMTYTLLEDAVGDTRRMDDDSVRHVRSDLVVVQGPPVVGRLLTAWLTEELSVESPKVIIIPGASPLSQTIGGPGGGRRPPPDAAPSDGAQGEEGSGV